MLKLDKTKEKQKFLCWSHMKYKTKHDYLYYLVYTMSSRVNIRPNCPVSVGLFCFMWVYLANNPSKNQLNCQQIFDNLSNTLYIYLEFVSHDKDGMFVKRWRGVCMWNVRCVDAADLPLAVAGCVDLEVILLWARRPHFTFCPSLIWERSQT